jgi:hypothetical protein
VVEKEGRDCEGGEEILLAVNDVEENGCVISRDVRTWKVSPRDTLGDEGNDCAWGCDDGVAGTIFWTLDD